MNRILVSMVVVSYSLANMANLRAATQLFVSPNGNDQWSGKLAAPNADKSDGPLATLAAARDAVRVLKKNNGAEPIRVILRGGTYRVEKPIVFRPEDSGTADAPIKYAAYTDEKPVLSGGRPIGGWRKSDGPLWTATIPRVRQGQWYFRQMFVNGRRAVPARTPNDGVFKPSGPLRPLGDRTKDGSFHQHYGRDNIVRNNILAFSCGRGQVVRTRNESHRSFTFEHNIVYYATEPLLGGNWVNPNGFTMDHNLYWHTTGKPPKFPGNLTLSAWQAKGHDLHSIVADPKFVAPDRYDFRLQEDSPAPGIGFQPIDISTTGLTGPDAWKNLPRQIKRPPFVMPWEE